MPERDGEEFKIWQNEFWIGWRKEYLMNLKPSQKWYTQCRNLNVDDLVLIRDDDAPRCKWKLAKIRETTSDEDGPVKKAKLNIDKKTPYKRDKTTLEVTILER